MITAICCLLGTFAIVGGGIGVWTYHKSMERIQSSGIVRSQPVADGVGVVKAISEDTRYVLNISSMKVHLPECTAVTEMAFENLVETEIDDLQALIDEGYEACFRCMPQEKQKD